LFYGTNKLGAQEVINHLNGNPQLKDYSLHYKKLKSSQDTLELPFFDDFSDSYFYPNQNKWTDNYAFINDTYPIDPPSIGVATLDAIDNSGEFYSDAGYGNYFSADTLSSLPINLNYPADNTIFLSFYYQPQGLGDDPEPADTLMLEFYSPVDSTWEKVWFAEGSVTKSFEQIIVPVDQDKYLKKGFRFRFRNIASLSLDSDPSQVVNVDHWHIDYVYLDRGQTHTSPKDMAFVYPMKTHLKRYESMPWKHFLFSPSSELGTNVNVTYKNNYSTTLQIDSIYFVFHDNSGNEPNDTLYGGTYDIPAGTQQVFNPPFVYSFLTNSVDSASFSIKAKLVAADIDRKMNNEVTYLQKFYDYYAYDDGTAEASYGLTGTGAQNGMLAYKFDCIKQDTLKAIQMYFTRSLFDYSQKYFYLTIWDDNDGQPGNIIYQREAVLPEYENELNKFHTYFIDDTTLIINRVFYVGWVQTTADQLNIGLDLNRIKNEYIFFNIHGKWENSTYEAALMIRPFFGKKLTTLIEPVVQKKIADVKVYPNPTSGEIKIDIGNFYDYQQVKLQIYNLSGRIVYQSDYQNRSTVNLSNLSEGIYLLKLTDKQRLLNFTQKIIKLK